MTLLFATLALLAGAPDSPASPRPQEPPAASALPRGQEELPDFTQPSPPPVPEESLSGQLVRTVLVLGIVVVLVYLTLNVGLRRLMGLRARSGAGSVISVLERIPLDQKRALFLVKAGGEYLLVGGAESGLGLIAKMDGPEVERLMRERPAAQIALSPFLQKLLAKRGPPPKA